MKGLEINKLAASVLLGIMLVVLVGVIANVLYRPQLTSVRGYSVHVSPNTASSRESMETSQEELAFDVPKLMASANAEAGREIIKKCIACHSFEKGATHKVGPNLWNVAGSSKGSVAGYKYSAALTGKGGSWDDESLVRFLYSPQKYIPGTKMSFAGIKKPEDLANVVAFLKQQVHD